MSDTMVAPTTTKYDQSDIDAGAALLANFDTARRGKEKKDPPEMIAKNLLENHSCHVDLMRFVGKLAGPNKERRLAALTVVVSAYLVLA